LGVLDYLDVDQNNVKKEMFILWLHSCHMIHPFSFQKLQLLSQSNFLLESKTITSSHPKRFDSNCCCQPQSWLLQFCPWYPSKSTNTLRFVYICIWL